MLENKRCRYIVACANRLYVYFLFMILVISSGESCKYIREGMVA